MKFSKKNTGLIVLFALVLTLIVLGGIYFGFKQVNKPEPQVEVAVATTNIKSGELLMSDKNYTYTKIDKSKVTSSHITKVQIETESNNEETKVALTDMLKGKEVITDIYAGEPIMKGRVSGLTGISNSEGEQLDLSKYRKMTYSVTNEQNLEGQVRSGDRVDFWVKYKLNDKTNKDQLIVVDKILKNVIVNKTFDANGQEINDPTIPAKTIEVLLLEKEIQEFLQYKDLGKFTIVKVPTGATEDGSEEIVRRKVSTNDLIWEIISMDEDAVTADKIKKDADKKDKVQDMELETND